MEFMLILSWVRGPAWVGTLYHGLVCIIHSKMRQLQMKGILGEGRIDAQLCLCLFVTRDQVVLVVSGIHLKNPPSPTMVSSLVWSYPIASLT